MMDEDVMDRPEEDTFRGIIDASGAILTDPDAEMQLLGRLMLRPADVFDLGELDASSLSDPLHRNLFDHIKAAIERDEKVTIETLTSGLGGNPNAKVFDDMTVGQYLARLMTNADPDVDLADLADHLDQIAERRAKGVVDDQELDANQPFKSSFGLKMWSDQNDPADEYEYIVEDLIPEREGVLLIGETQTGKSFLTYHLAMCGARGVPFFGRRILQPFGTIWCAYEAARGATARMRAYRKHHGLELDHLPFGVLTKPLALWPDPKAVDELVKEMKAIERTQFRGVPLKMIVFDTYNAATPGASEIDSEVVSKIRANFDRFRQLTGAASLIVGHTNAVGKHRGNEQLTNNIDTVIVVSRKTKQLGAKEVIEDKDDEGRAVRVMKVKKQREGLDGEEQEFVLHVVEDGTKNKFGKMRTSCVVAAPIIADPPAEGQGGKGSADGVGAKITRQDALFLECLLEATDDRGVTPPLELALPRSIGKVVDYEHVKRLMAKKMLREEDNTEEGLKKHRQAVKQAVKRARERLAHVKVINGDGALNLIWWTGKPARGVKATQPQTKNLFDNEPPLSDDDITGLY